MWLGLICLGFFLAVVVGLRLVSWLFLRHFPSIRELKRDKKCNETEGNNIPVIIY